MGGSMPSHTLSSVPSAVLAAVVLLATLMAGPVGAASPYSYQGPGVVVTQDAAGNTLIDNGVVRCQLAAPSGGQGGFCIPFSDISASGSTLTVNDASSGTNVSYQVCLDNNGNGVCGDSSGGCSDLILFSHSSSSYANPMSGLPTSHAAGCPGSVGFDGLVVFICQGVHDTHVENASTGTGTLSSGSGTAGFTEPGPPVPFCGGAPLGKAYLASQGAPEDFGVFEGVGNVSAGSSNCGSGGLQLPSTAPQVGCYSLSTVVTFLLAGAQPLNVSGRLGPVAGVGAACGMSRGHSGSGTAGPYAFSNIGWPFTAGGVLPIQGQWSLFPKTGTLSAVARVEFGASCATSGGATAFSIVGAMIL
jgi:hypothetical protein